MARERPSGFARARQPHADRPRLTVCLEFPCRVIAVDADGVSIDREGRVLRASALLIDDLAPGDWVYVAAGTVIERLEPDQAAWARSALLEAVALEEAERILEQQEA